MRNKLLLYRTEAGLTQREIAKLANITDRYYRYVESGKKQPTIPVANKLAEAVGKTMDEVFN